jgi:hypothetical protein
VYLYGENNKIINNQTLKKINMEQLRPEEIANAVSIIAEALLKLHTAGLVEQSNIDKANMLLGKLLDNVILSIQEGSDVDHDMEPPMEK